MSSRSDVADQQRQFSATRATVMSVHLCSTVPLGGTRSARRGTDEWGAVPGVGNVTVNDASLLPDAPGVNPQATVMALGHPQHPPPPRHRPLPEERREHASGARRHGGHRRRRLARQRADGAPRRRNGPTVSSRSSTTRPTETPCWRSPRRRGSWSVTCPSARGSTPCSPA
ncbi:MAG: GMC oxidoreductase [Ilumatobacteraceae bacterium]